MHEFVELLKTNPVGLLSQEVLESREPLSVVKGYFDQVIQLNKNDTESKTTLDEIVVDGLDANQVWWQSKIVLDNTQAGLMHKISSLSVHDGESNEEDSEEDDEQEEDNEDAVPVGSDDDLSNGFSAEEEEEEDNDEAASDDEGKVSATESLQPNNEENENINDDSDSGLEDEKFEEAQESREAIEDKFGINDTFFNLDEFNKQTLEEENNTNQGNSDEEIDYFGDIPSEEEEEAIYYDDFFDKPKEKQEIGKVSKKSSENSRFQKGKEQEENESFDESEYEDAMEEAKLDLFADEDDYNGSDAEDNAQPLSTFERQQLEVQRQIQKLEEEAVAEKKWALKGEVKARDRPEDALLTEDLEFERTAKPVPLITSEVTESLENMIRRRIKEEDFNDLQRRVITDVSGFKSKPKFELSDVKSSKSLAEIYEDDFKGVTEDVEISEELQKSHDEISELYKDLTYKLDALSSAHFIPKPIKKDLEVRVQTAAISMEDAQPLTMSNASTLAPQEIYKVGKSENANEITLKNGVVMSRDELTREDKNRLRRAVKRKRSKLSSKMAEQPKKKNKKDEVLETLSKSKNITVIDKKGAKTDIKGNVKKDNSSNSINFKL